MSAPDDDYQRPRDWPFVLRYPAAAGALSAVAIVLGTFIVAPPLGWVFGGLLRVIAPPFKWWWRYWLG